MEYWKDIKGYEGYYQVSNLGNVRSLGRYYIDKIGRVRVKNGRILKTLKNNKGYVVLRLSSKDHIDSKFFVHRLVADAFLQNDRPESFNIVNHIDFNRTNNNADNLEWTDLSGNSRHAVENGRFYVRPVIATNIETGEQMMFSCLNHCIEKGFYPSAVWNCCNGIAKSHKGHFWNYVE